MQAQSPCTCFAVRRLSRRLTQLYDHHLAGLGLKTTQYSLLSHARARSGQSMGELAQAMGMDRSTLTRNLRPLADAGWVQTARGEDTRTVAVTLTAAGRTLLREAHTRWRRAQDELEAQLGPEPVRRLHLLAEDTARRLEHAGARPTAARTTAN